MRNIREDTYEAKLLKAELIDNLRFTTFLKFSRYLQGRKIASLVCEKIKLISWFENQTIDKNLYKGIREGENKIKIYGAQPFIFSKSILNILADENEAKFGVVPDRMVVSGSYFIPEDSALDFVVGPSFRYKKLFTAALDEKNRSNIVILLPYFAEDAENILNLLNKTKIPVRNIIVKAHPATPTERFKCIIPKGAKVSSADAYEIFRTAKIVIGAASGTLIEAVSLGIPVICIKGVQGFDYNPLLVYGKGIIWDEAVNTRDLERLLATFESALNNIDELDGIKKIASKYKNMFFCEPSDESIIKVYGLDC